MSDRTFYYVYAAVIATASIAALGAFFPWGTFTGESGTSYLDGYRTDDGPLVLAYCFATLFLLAVYRYFDRLWLLVIATVPAALMLDVSARVMKRLQGLDYSGTREFSVGYGIYLTLAAACLLMLLMGLLLWDRIRFGPARAGL